jgi:hypothetical protein
VENVGLLHMGVMRLIMFVSRFLCLPTCGVAALDAAIHNPLTMGAKLKTASQLHVPATATLAVAVAVAVVATLAVVAVAVEVAVQGSMHRAAPDSQSMTFASNRVCFAPTKRKTTRKVAL